MSYAKVFSSIYDGSLRGNWKALVTFQQLLVLKDRDGVVDMTPHSISHRTGIPLRIILEGLGVLEAPDPDSRSKAEDGRRIVRLDPAREWGWRIVNAERYRNEGRVTEARERTRERVRRHRAKRRGARELAPSVTVSNGVTPIQMQIQREDIAQVPSEPSPVARWNPALVFPIRGQKTWSPTPEQIERWVEHFPRVDVIHEMSRARGWLIDNPRRMKTSNGMARYITGWLERESARRMPRGAYRRASDEAYRRANQGGAK